MRHRQGEETGGLDPSIRRGEWRDRCVLWEGTDGNTKVVFSRGMMRLF